MSLKVLRFVAVMFAALTLAMGICHLMQLPARMAWDQYLWVGSTVQGGLYGLFGSIGAIIGIVAIIVLFLHAYIVREHGRPDSISLSPLPFCLRRRLRFGGCWSIRRMSSWRNGSTVRFPTIGPRSAHVGNAATRSFLWRSLRALLR